MQEIQHRKHRVLGRSKKSAVSHQILATSNKKKKGKRVNTRALKMTEKCMTQSFKRDPRATSIKEAHRVLNAAKRRVKRLAKESTRKREAFLEGLSKALESDGKKGEEDNKSIVLESTPKRRGTTTHALGHKSSHANKNRGKCSGTRRTNRPS